MSLLIALPVLVASGAAAFVGHAFLFGADSSPYLGLLGMLLIGGALVGVVISISLATSSSGYRRRGTGLPFTISVALVLVIALFKFLFGGWGM